MKQNAFYETKSCFLLLLHNTAGIGTRNCAFRECYDQKGFPQIEGGPESLSGILTTTSCDRLQLHFPPWFFTPHDTIGHASRCWEVTNRVDHAGIPGSREVEKVTCVMHRPPPRLHALSLFLPLKEKVWHMPIICMTFLGCKVTSKHYSLDDRSRNKPCNSANLLWLVDKRRKWLKHTQECRTEAPKSSAQNLSAGCVGVLNHISHGCRIMQINYMVEHSDRVKSSKPPRVYIVKWSLKTRT